MSMDFATVPVTQFDAYLRSCCDAYYSTGTPLLADAEYDKLLSLYKQRFKCEFRNIGSLVAPTKDSQKVLLPFLMGSLDKVKEAEDFDRWMKKLSVLKVRSLVLSNKADGCSAMLWYMGPSNDDVQLTTQGDGQVGFKINHLKKHLNLPPADKVWKAGIRCVRMELIVNRKAFEQLKLDLNDPSMSNPRNTVSGIINGKTLDAAKLRAISALAYWCKYDNDGDQCASQRFTDLEAVGFTTCQWEECNMDDTTLTVLQNITRQRKASTSYDIDGLVVEGDISVKQPFTHSFEECFHDDKTVVNLKQLLAANMLVKNPSHAFALKLPDEALPTTVIDVEWSYSAWGVMNPVVVFDMVKPGQTEIRRASGGSGRAIFTDNIGPGSRITVLLSNEVIPYISQILAPSTTGKPAMPAEAWQWTTTQQGEGDDIVLVDPMQHPSVQLARMVMFFKKMGTKNMKEATVERLVHHFKGDLRKLLRASVSELCKVERFAKTSAERTHQSLQECRVDVSLAKLMEASCCMGEGVGSTRLHTILDAHPDLLSWEVKTKPQQDVAIGRLQLLPGIKSLAEQVVKQLPVFTSWLNALKDTIQVQPHRAPAMVDVQPNSTQLMYKNVAFSGTRCKPLEAALISRGGKVVSTVSSTTDAVVLNERNTGNNKEAQAMAKQIPIFSHLEFATILGVQL